METKICTHCKIEKSIDQFDFLNKSKGSRHSWCKDCCYQNKLKSYSQKEETGLLTRIGTITARELKRLGQKRCPGCKMVKCLENDFNKSGFSNGGYASHCRNCQNTLAKELYHTPKQKQKRKIYYSQSKERNRARKLQREFGITVEEYNEILSEQNGVCAICQKRDDDKVLAVDHNHKTGKVRGLLCGKCNPALGFLQESPELIKRLLSYIEKYNT